MTRDQIRLLHISDLHFCAPRFRPLLQRANTLVQKHNVDFDIHFDNQCVISALDRLIAETKPAGLIISGDVTTFGDAASYSVAEAWLKPHLTNEQGRRPCIVVPGNHDVLLSQARVLRARLSELDGFQNRMFARIADWMLKRVSPDIYGKYRDNGTKLLGILDEMLQQEKSQGTDPLTNFRDFAERVGCSPNGERFELGLHSKIIVYPFNSVSLDPLWVNLGAARDSERQRLSGLLHPPEEGVLRILVMHHNPMSSAYRVDSPMVSAYNGMPSGPNILATMQKAGVDLFLYGHQHEDAFLQFDFELGTAGHAIALGCRSSSHLEHGGCNVIDIQDINHAELTTYTFDQDQQRFATRNDTRTLCFERHRPNDPVTATARYETKRLIPDDEAAFGLWQEILQPGSDIVYIAGRHLQEAANEKIDELRKILDGPPECKVRLLVNNPELLRFLADQMKQSQDEEIYGPEVAQALSKVRRYNVWGEDETLEELATTAHRNVEKLKQYIGDVLSAKHRARVNLRVSHTVLPFAAIVRNPVTEWGQMVVRFLPMGAFNDLTTPVVKLNQRSNRALYYYYLRHLKLLLLRGTSIAGDWNDTDDLS